MDVLDLAQQRHGRFPHIHEVDHQHMGCGSVQLREQVMAMAGGSDDPHMWVSLDDLDQASVHYRARIGNSDTDGGWSQC
jgi:hypothetical protein